MKMARALGITTDYLLGNTEELRPQEIVLRDPDAEYIVNQYAKLSAARRRQLKEFADFLVREDRSS